MQDSRRNSATGDRPPDGANDGGYSTGSPAESSCGTTARRIGGDRKAREVNETYLSDQFANSTPSRKSCLFAMPVTVVAKIEIPSHSILAAALRPRWSRHNELARDVRLGKCFAPA